MSQQPDVILIHCHDLGRWLGAYGVEGVPTPNLDRFAETAVVFENAHSAAPLCSPARAALFTGMAPHRNGVEGLSHHGWRYRAGVRTLPELLRPQGYHSVLVGLQHENPDPDVLGFDEVRGAGFLPRANAVVDDAIEWFTGLPERSSRQPYFVSVGLWEVHRPWPAEDYDAADPESVVVPAYLPDAPETREDIAGFYGSVAQMDAAVGRLLRAVDATFDPECTVVVFTTDHGAAFPRAKGTLYDAGTGVALLVRAPGVEAHRESAVVSHLDLAPTVLELAGAEPNDELDGMSLVSLLAQPGSADPQRIVYTQKSYHDDYDPIRCARSRDFAFIRNLVDGPRLRLSLDLERSSTRAAMDDAHLEPRQHEEFFDRRIDADELVNRVDDPRYSLVVGQYRMLLADQMAASHDPALVGGSPPPPQRSRETDALAPLIDPVGVKAS